MATSWSRTRIVVSNSKIVNTIPDFPKCLLIRPYLKNLKFQNVDEYERINAGHEKEWNRKWLACQLLVQLDYGFPQMRLWEDWHIWDTKNCVMIGSNFFWEIKEFSGNLDKSKSSIFNNLLKLINSKKRLIYFI
jgi:hypothetical protein